MKNRPKTIMVIQITTATGVGITTPCYSYVEQKKGVVEIETDSKVGSRITPFWRRVINVEKVEVISVDMTQGNEV